MRRRLVLSAVFTLWALVYAGLAMTLGPLWAGAALLGLTGVAGLTFLHRYPGVPGQRGALLGVLCFAALCALLASLDRDAEPWWAVGIPLLFGAGLVLVSSAGELARQGGREEAQRREHVGYDDAAT
jgi:peptidoglycan/LPS O-acetylase OafA/YrhL